MEISIEERKEAIRKEMNNVMFQIEMNKFNNEKLIELKEAYNNLKKEYKKLLIEEKMAPKKCK